MATRITLGLEAAGKDSSVFLVQEDFDTVVDRFWPLNQAGSNLEARTNNIFTTLENKRILIKTPAIIVIEEDCDES